MKAENMKPIERIEAALHLEKPDRTPVAPLLTMDSIARWKGRLQSDWVKDWSWVLPATMEHFDAFGGWDAPFIPTSPTLFAFSFFTPMKMKLPGIDLPDDYQFQFVEEAVLQPEDYDTIADIGWTEFWRSDFVFRIRDYKPKEFPALQAEDAKIVPEAVAAWRQRGVEPLCGAACCHPFFMLSMARSLVKFTEDLYYTPDRVEAALKTMTPEIIDLIIQGTRATGIPRVQIPEEHASAYYYPFSIFERLWWPFTREIVEALWSEGIFSIWHLDMKWDKNLHYFKELPRGSMALELDSTTDIFLAKEILGDYLPIMGDVPAPMLTIGTPEEVRDYCQKLIDTVGYNGGFVLKNACVLPPDCKPENFQAMIDTAKTYELSK